MKKISEMSLEELQDYALKLQEDVAAGQTRENELTEKVNTLTGLNQSLQTRNNALLMKVEQQSSGPAEPPKEEKIESCEDFARRLVKGG